ncbi:MULTISPECIES: trypsin-like peptidase domain-containing protein [Fischerella]|uniref:trypsin-like peptidase domain-containing protein n=1 Tax=Fischerella TaxID=1190 RepID=UPI0002DA2A35|nr:MULTISPECIES: trypsin-like peptidase domain-containing protein [Fischerella]
MDGDRASAELSVGNQTNPDSSQKTQQIQLTVFQHWLQKLSTYTLILLISIGMVLFQGWSSPAYAYGSTLVAQIDPESNFVTAAVEKVESAVVQVNVSRTLGGDVPDVLKPFLGGVRAVPPSAQILRGIGSGFVIDPTGLILTNAHVVNQADTVTVSFQDGRILAGKVLGKDPVTDVAVIQVQAGDNLPTVVMGDSDKVRQGQWAIAIGNPLGLQETVTVGVISGTERSCGILILASKQGTNSTNNFRYCKHQGRERANRRNLTVFTKGFVFAPLLLSKLNINGRVKQDLDTHCNW